MASWLAPLSSRFLIHVRQQQRGRVLSKHQTVRLPFWCYPQGSAPASGFYPQARLLHSRRLGATTVRHRAMMSRDCGLSTTSNDPMQQAPRIGLPTPIVGHCFAARRYQRAPNFYSTPCGADTHRGGYRVSLSRHVCFVWTAPSHLSQSAWVTATSFVRAAGSEGFPFVPTKPFAP